MVKFFDLLNDYRDSLYYSCSLVLSVMVGFHPLAVTGLGLWLFGTLIWAREFVRFLFRFSSFAVPYTAKEITYARISVIIFTFENGTEHLVHLINGKHGGWSLCFVVLNSFIVISYYLWIGLPLRVLAGIFFKDMWDWPRKQKPPCDRDKSKKALRDLLNKCREAFHPTPPLIPQQASGGLSW